MGCKGRYRLVRVRMDRGRSDRKRRIRVRTVGDSEEGDGETESEAEGVAEAMDECVVHVTQATLIFYRGVNPLSRGSDAKRYLTAL